MSEPTTISFIGTPELKAMLELWAKAEDRTVSATLRQILEREAQRRKQGQNSEQKPLTQQSH